MIWRVIAVLLGLVGIARAQTPLVPFYLNSSTSGAVPSQPGLTPVSPQNPFPTICISGCGGGSGGGGTSSNFGSAFPAAGTAIGVENSGSTAMTYLKVDSSNNLNINIAASGAALTVTDSVGDNFASVVAAINSAAIPVPLPVTGNTATDGSTTLTTANTAQNLFSAVTPTNGFQICDPDATHDLWWSDTTTAVVNGTGSHRIASNGGCDSPPLGRKVIGTVSIIGTLTGQHITASQW